MYRNGEKEIAALTNVLRSGDLFKINGGVQESLHVEEKLRTLFGSKYAVFMTSGHAALTSALIGMGIGPGDQVIVPAYTYISTAMAVVAAGAIPVIAEVDETLTLSPTDFERKITPHTKAVIPVHIQGFPCDMAAITAIAARHNVRVLEDACQADGGSYRGQRLGTIGDAGALSFNFYKIVSCGEGGALLTNDKTVFERAFIYHDSSAVAFFGNQLEGFAEEGVCGNEYRSNELCAAMLNAQLEQLDDILADLRRNKRYMAAALEDTGYLIPSHDAAGDCGTTLALRFESEEAARRFATADGMCGVLPIDTGKHVYTHWTPILTMRGAWHPLMDPFKMEANRDILPQYRKDMCPATLHLLSTTVYIAVDPAADTAALDSKLTAIRAALQA